MFQETDHKFEELAETVKNTNRKVGELTDEWDEFVESMVEPVVRPGPIRRDGADIERRGFRGAGVVTTIN